MYVKERNSVKNSLSGIYAKYNARLDIEDIRLTDTLTNGGIQKTTFVNESGLYTVILRSDSPLEKPMQTISDNNLQ